MISSVHKVALDYRNVYYKGYIESVESRINEANFDLHCSSILFRVGSRVSEEIFDV